MIAMIRKDRGNPPGPFCRISRGDRNHQSLPEFFKSGIIRPQGVFPDHSSAGIPVAVHDDHPVTRKGLADLRAGCIDRAGGGITARNFPEERADLRVCAGRCVSLHEELIRNLLSKCRINPGREEQVVNGAAAIIIPVIELALDNYGLPEADTALAAPVAGERGHNRDNDSGGYKCVATGSA